MTGPIAVTTPGGTGTSSTAFKVKPRITSFSPASLARSRPSVTVTGTGADVHPMASQSGRPDPDLVQPAGSDTGLTFTVPAGRERSGERSRSPRQAGPITSAATVHGDLRPARQLGAVDSTVGPPTTTVTLTGTGFAPYEAVDVYADADRGQADAATGSGGAFTASALTVPSSAPAGQFWFTAVGRRSGLRRPGVVPGPHGLARATATPQSAGAYNAYENVLNTNNVTERRSWTGALPGRRSPTSPAVRSSRAGCTVAPVAYSNQLVALRPDGTTAWTAALSSPLYAGPDPGGRAGTTSGRERQRRQGARLRPGHRSGQVDERRPR